MSLLEQKIYDVVERSKKAFLAYSKISGHQKKQFLYNISEELLNLGDVLIESAMEESQLPRSRFIGERTRTCYHFQAFGDYVMEGSWVDATIDSSIEDRPHGRKPDMRMMLKPLGPIVVFGASNFPLAYSAPGGDTASALAAGCTVIVKGHPSHPKTSAWVEKAMHRACDKSGIDRDIFILVQEDTFEAGRLLVTHPQVAGVGFTGSLSGGRAIFDHAQKRKIPIPVFAEMGSTNPVLLMPEKLKNQSENIAIMLSKSMTMGVGQFCTNPGIVLGIKSKALDSFKNQLTVMLANTPAFKMLNDGIYHNFDKGIQQVSQSTGVNYLLPFRKETDIKTTPVLATVSGADFLSSPHLKEEIFGPFSIIVECHDITEMREVWTSLGGQLTTTFMADDADMDLVKTLMGDAESMAGRIVFNFEPTGVEVGYATVHGGPYPATTDSRFTSVGMNAIKRWVRPVCYQDCPQILLPNELKDDNPLKIWRKVDGNTVK